MKEKDTNSSSNHYLGDRAEEIANICSKKEFTARELFKAFDVDGDGIISKADLEKLAESDENRNYFSRKDLENIYSKIGKKICRGVCQILDEQTGKDHIKIDDLFTILDKNNDGKIVFGDFLRIAKKDGNLLFINQDEFEKELESAWEKS